VRRGHAPCLPVHALVTPRGRQRIPLHGGLTLPGTLQLRQYAICLNPGGEFFGPRQSRGFCDSARNRNLGSRIYGTLIRFWGPMTVQRDQKHHRDFVRGAKHQLTLLGAATLVLLFFAWT
jgi:hypothetical protein